MKRTIFISVFLTASLFCCGVVQGQSVKEQVERLQSRAETAYEMGNFQNAIKEYLSIRDLMPNYPDVHKALGNIYEKLGSDDDLKAAIECYSQYIKLSPNAADKKEIQRKIYSLEYIYEQQLQQTQVLNDLSGTWVSDLVSKTDASKKYVILQIEEIQQTGKFRITIHISVGENETTKNFDACCLSVTSRKKRSIMRNHKMFPET